MLYKIIQENRVIDVVKNPYFVRFLSYGHIAMTDKTSAQGILGSDRKTIYSLVSETEQGGPFVKIEQISEKEFNRLQSLLNSNQIVSADESELAKAKKNAIKDLSKICKSQIIAGFSVTLSDGNDYNFKLTQEDQLNLMLIETQLNNNETLFVYHATDLPCKIFSREDMTKIIKNYKHHILYHTTYFNAAKQYIKSLTDIEEVNLFSYGKDVSSIIEDVTLKQILKNGDNQV